MIYLYRLVAVAASEGVELGVATGSLYLFLREKVRLLGRNTVIMVVKYDYRQERVKWQQKKTNGGNSGSIEYPEVFSLGAFESDSR